VGFLSQGQMGSNKIENVVKRGEESPGLHCAGVFAAQKENRGKGLNQKRPDKNVQKKFQFIPRRGEEC